MDKQAVIKRLRAHEAELRGLGIKRLSLFGSVARGEAGEGSDVDLAAELDHSRRIGGFEFAGMIIRLAELLGVRVDLLSEPARNPRLQAELDQDRVHVF